MCAAAPSHTRPSAQRRESIEPFSDPFHQTLVACSVWLTDFGVAIFANENAFKEHNLMEVAVKRDKRAYVKHTKEKRPKGLSRAERERRDLKATQLLNKYTDTKARLYQWILENQPEAVCACGQGLKKLRSKADSTQFVCSTCYLQELEDVVE